MSGQFDLTQPLALLLLPLALLPLLPRRGDALLFGSVGWLPPDRIGRWVGIAWRVCALLAIAFIVVALAGPGCAQSELRRFGRGAEILLLIDRSRSMDENMLTSDWRQLDPLVVRAQARSRGEQKGKVARDIVAKFVMQRPDDRFAVMFFSANPIRVVPFTEQDEMVHAAIAAGGIGRGITNTDVGRALISAIGEFDARGYSGSRMILLISDGGAQLDTPTRQRIREGLLRNRIALEWIYLRSVNGPDLANPEGQAETLTEVALHRFFQSLSTPYTIRQAQTREDLNAAVADLGRKENFPLDYTVRVPRRDYARHCLAAAVFFCLLLLGYRAAQIRSWT